MYLSVIFALTLLINIKDEFPEHLYYQLSIVLFVVLPLATYYLAVWLFKH